MKKVVLSVGIGISFICGCTFGFGPDYDSAEIKQNIGGTLICNSIYNADHHSWQYDVSYRYKPENENIIDIGSGTYYGREWNKDEQLIQFDNWIILKTGGWSGTDKVIIGDLRSKQFIEYEFTPENIEKDSLWQNSNTPSLLNWCCSETFVDKINNGQIVINYKFRTSEKQVDEYGQRKIYYSINKATALLKMTRIE